MKFNRTRNTQARSISPKNSTNHQQQTIQKRNLAQKSITMIETKNKLKKSSDTHLTKFYNISEIEKIKKMNKLTIGKEKLRQIKRILEIQNMSQLQYKNRLKNNNLYFKYDVNSFTEHLHSEQTQKVQDFKSKKKKVQLIQTLRKDNFIKKLQSRLQKIETNAQKTAELLKAQLKKTKNKKKNTFSQSFHRLDAPTTSRNLTSVSFVEAACDELQAIVGIKQKSFFRLKRDREPFNLFEFITNPKSVMFQSGTTQLELNKFYFFLPQKTGQSYNQIDIHISTYSRLWCIKSNPKNIPDSFKLTLRDLRFNTDSLTANDILLIASGHLNYDLALVKLQEEQGQQIIKVYNNVETVHEKPINYKQKERNKLSKIFGESEGKAEIYLWKKMPKTQKQIEQEQISKNHLEDMKEVLEQQIVILNHNILRPSVHKRFEKIKQDIVLNQLEDNSDLMTYLKGQNQKKIRIFKQSKDKSEGLKLKLVQSSLENKKKMLKFLKAQIKKHYNLESISKQKSQEKSKSKSKSKSKPKPKSKSTYK